ncbi:g3978 [Coccomyxa elongata]
MGQNDTLVGRGESIPEAPQGPVVVCTRNDALDDVVASTPPNRRKDLVFIQNGMLQPWLDKKGLGDNTQVLVYFAVAKKGEAPVDGKTDLNPEGLTAAWGLHAEAVAERLRANGLSCSTPDKPDFVKAMLEKLVWISAYMLVGARHKATIGEVEGQYRSEVGSLIEELATGGAAELGVSLDDGYIERLHAYSRSVAHFPTAVKEFQWRNGWFFDLSKKAEAEGKSDPFPTHTAWLKEIGVV